MRSFETFVSIFGSKMLARIYSLSQRSFSARRGCQNIPACTSATRARRNLQKFWVVSIKYISCSLQISAWHFHCSSHTIYVLVYAYSSNCVKETKTWHFSEFCNIFKTLPRRSKLATFVLFCFVLITIESCEIILLPRCATYVVQIILTEIA